jgi:hypothetical protein
VVGTACDRVLSINGGPMWHSGLIRPLAQLETGWGRGKSRIPDRKIGERSIVMFGALNVVAPACVD